MADLPTCWYCPECGYVAPVRVIHATWNEPTPGIDSYEECPGEMVEVPLFPPGTPLPRILDALGHTYREGWGLFYDQPETEWSASPHQHENDVPVLVVDNPATDEAQ